LSQPLECAVGSDYLPFVQLQELCRVLYTTHSRHLTLSARTAAVCLVDSNTAVCPDYQKCAGQSPMLAQMITHVTCNSSITAAHTVDHSGLTLTRQHHVAFSAGLALCCAKHRMGYTKIHNAEHMQHIAYSQRHSHKPSVVQRIPIHIASLNQADTAVMMEHGSTQAQQQQHDKYVHPACLWF